MDRATRDMRRAYAKDLERIAREKRHSQHTCENCGEKGAHWVQTGFTTLHHLFTGMPPEGFWICPKLYGPDGRRIEASAPTYAKETG